MKIHIANLTRETPEEKVREAFGTFGKVDSVKLVIDKITGKPNGFAFVEMPEESEAHAAIAGLHKKELNGSVISLKEVEEEERQRPGFRPARGTRGAQGGKGAGGKQGGGYNKGGNVPQSGAVRRGGQRGS